MWIGSLKIQSMPTPNPITHIVLLIVRSLCYDNSKTL